MSTEDTEPHNHMAAATVRRSDIATPAEISEAVRQAQKEREAAIKQYGQPNELPGTWELRIAPHTFQDFTEEGRIEVPPHKLIPIEGNDR